MKIHSLFPLFLARGVRAAQAVQPKQAAPETPWEELRVVLSSPNILNLPTVSEWEEQCLRPMLFNVTLPDTLILYGYDIGFQPAGGKFSYFSMRLSCLAAFMHVMLVR